MNPYDIIVTNGKDEPLKVPGNYARLKTGSVPITVKSPENDQEVDLVQGEWAQLKDFSYLLLSHDDAAEQAITIEIGDHTSKGSSQVGGSVQVTGGSDNTATPPLVNVNSGQLTPFDLGDEFLYANNLAVTLFTIVTPAANTNGIRVNFAQCNVYQSGAAVVRFMAKASAPTGVYDATAKTVHGATSGNTTSTKGEAMLQNPIIIPPGLGLYFQSSDSSTGGNCYINYEVL